MMDLQSSNNKIISKPDISLLMSKVKEDLSAGVKIFGNEINHNDVIRVWTSYEDNIFGLIATSSNRYNSSVNYIEIQSFKQKPYLKLSLINKSTDNDIPQIDSRITLLNENFFELAENVDENLSKEFIEQYLRSKPDPKLTKFNFEKYAYNKKQYEWLKPELYQT
ncbi:MAG TPA: hypothetical protein PKU78_03825 [Candidatus Dojkabacteria bacterium]|nr:hypothetical protein [Candidatus Dojkabacteria bacterium]HRO65323.1 hypothetical protein [Candidatus Dojkabacteria bacterium]HRP51129.1 hypothetical protein [Candidatus Dojkabacteria bacterium]